MIECVYGAHPPAPPDDADELTEAVDADELPAPPPPTLLELVLDVDVDEVALDVEPWVLDVEVVEPDPVDDPVGGSSMPAAQDIVAIENRRATVLRIGRTILDQRK